MKIKALAAIAVAGIMVMSVPMVAMAADVTEQVVYDYYNGHKTTDGDGDDNKLTINGNVVINDNLNAISDGKGAMNITVTGDVESKSASGQVVAVINASNIEVGGDIINSNTSSTGAVVGMTSAGASVTVGGEVNGNAGIYVTAGTCTADSVTATGRYGAQAKGANAVVNITKEAQSQTDSAILAKDGGKVTAGSATNTSNYGAGGNATVKAEGITTTDPAKQTKVEVNGAVTNNGSYFAIEASNGATVIAGSATNGVVVKENSCVTIKAYNEGTTVIIEEKDGVAGATGDVTNNGDSNSAVWVQDGATVVIEGTAKNNDSGEGTVVIDGGELIVYKLENTADSSNLIDSDSKSPDNVYYIIRGMDNANFGEITGTTGKSITAGGITKSYDTAKKGEVITVSVASGYELKVGEIKVTENADGTYSVTIPEGGGVTLEAIMKAVQSAGGGATFTSTPTSQGSSSAPITSGSWAQASNGKFTYTNNGEKLINCTAWIQYTDANGQVVTGKFCFDNNGYALVNTWKEVQSGVWNYFGSDGRMVTNTTTPDGYVVDASGEWRK